ncbi:hypothetical protein COOONC_09073 [Cooperia oncophora]
MRSVVLTRSCSFQDFRDPSVQPVIVEKCDVYFHREVIPDWSKNSDTIGELFVGFLDYYARFDFSTQHMISIYHITAYAPQSGCDDVEKEQFWTELQDHIAAVPESEAILLCGDLNGHSN